jgi:pyruvate kinase
VATLGPSSESPEVVAALLAAGVDVFRLNYSHGTHADHGRVLEVVRRAAVDAGRDVAVLQDLGGPKIRTGEVSGGGTIRWETGARITLAEGAVPLSPGVLSTNLAHLGGQLQVGHRVLLSDGRVALRVTAANGPPEMEVVLGGETRSRAGVNLPDTELGVPSFTDKDRGDLGHGLAGGVELVALSFVRAASDLDAPREVAEEAGKDLFLVAKIEKPEAVDRLDGILDAADAVMVARGDLGVEMPPEEVPFLQKRIIAAANARRMPVITATQMLESMMDRPVPTRAEASDVANAILDGTDAVMLSGETAVGAFPVEAVRVMDRIARRADLFVRAPVDARNPSGDDPMLPVALAAGRIAEEVDACALVVFTESGRTARFVSSHRPSVPVIALTPKRSSALGLALSWGVRAVEMPFVDSMEEMLTDGEQLLIDSGFVRQGDRVVVVSGSRSGRPGGTHLLKVMTVGEMDDSGTDRS